MSYILSSHKVVRENGSISRQDIFHNHFRVDTDAWLSQSCEFFYRIYHNSNISGQNYPDSFGFSGIWSHCFEIINAMDQENSFWKWKVTGDNEADTAINCFLVENCFPLQNGCLLAAIWQWKHPLVVKSSKNDSRGRVSLTEQELSLSWRLLVWVIARSLCARKNQAKMFGNFVGKSVSRFWSFCVEYLY